MLNKKLTTANVTVKYDENQQMVRDLQMKKAAGALSIDDVISSDITISRKLLFTSSWYLEIAIAKRCRLHKLIRQRFALALKIQQMLFALITSRKIPVASYSGSSRKLHCYCISSRHGIQTQEKQNRKKADVVESYNPDARFQSQYLKIQQKRKAVEE
ncbi:hypothetical protein F511_24495 [Dorcoceras hygrometricum]|uniref:Uncharacterized protein n=1 Tax=Dorcoceras hygrometricum TaxID=472368 RepID=A0A2Z7BTS6_9LAMI|nr:hypothetical protein F511_24495 [Dorcoceras hygrometricum]